MWTLDSYFSLSKLRLSNGFQCVLLAATTDEILIVYAMHDGQDLKHPLRYDIGHVQLTDLPWKLGKSLTRMCLARSGSDIIKVGDEPKNMLQTYRNRKENLPKCKNNDN